VIKKQVFVLMVVVLFTSCTSTTTEIPIMTPEGALSRSVETMDTYYKLINDAQTEDDLTIPWNMLTLEAQCNPRDPCSLFGFQNRQWPTKVLYKLYDCGSNRVVAEEMQYPRDADISAAGDPQYWKYQLVELEGVMMISNVRKSQVPGEDCVLVEIK